MDFYTALNTHTNNNNTLIYKIFIANTAGVDKKITKGVDKRAIAKQTGPTDVVFVKIKTNYIQEDPYYGSRTPAWWKRFGLLSS